MNRILEINVEENWVRVEAGVIKDQLNDFLKPFGYFFAPDLSTSNRATVGGMINTDASGQGSLVYGKTSDHVLAMDAVLIDGTEFSTNKMPVEQAKALAKENTIVGNLYNTVLNIGLDNRALILEKFPRLNRFLTGYDLENIFNKDLNEFDLGRVLTGSEGSLAVVTHAKLNITPIANFKTLINIKYDSFDSALRNSPFLVEARATSVETVDSKVLNLAKEDIIWHSVSDLITDVPGKDMQGLNMVEFNGETQTEIDDKVKTLCARLDELITGQQAGLIGYQLLTDRDDILKIYAMRKKSVGLLGKTASSKKPLAFAEDTAVPPEHLADYIQEFRDLLDSHNLDYGMFGHVDAGVLHVRPALDMCDPEQEVLLREISDKVVALTAKYGGLMWGEHAIGKLVKGDDIMSPAIKVFVDDEASEAVSDKVRRRLGHFIDRKIAAAFEHLITMKDDEALPGLAKGVAFRLAESLGVIPRSAIAHDIKALDQDQRGTLRKHGIRFGQYTIFHHLMLKPSPTRLRLVLWSLFEGLDEFPEAPPAGLVTVPAVVDAPKGYYPRAGYRLAGERAIRIDMLERLADMIRSFDVKVGFEANPDMLSITGMTLEQFADLMQGLGYAAEKGEREKVKPVVEAKTDAAAVTSEKQPKEAAPVEEEDTKEVFYIFKWVPKARPAARPAQTCLLYTSPSPRDS